MLCTTWKVRPDLVFAVLVAFGLLITDQATAQWQPTNGPYGAFVVDVAAHDGHVLAATFETGVFASVGGGGVGSGGAVWKDISAGIPAAARIHLIELGSDPVTVQNPEPDAVAWIATTMGLYRASAQAAGDFSPWTLAEGLPRTNIRALDVHLDTVFVNTDSGMYFSLNSGATWTSLIAGVQQPPTFDAKRVGCFLHQNGVLLVGLVASPVPMYRSTDGGATWTQPRIDSLDVGFTSSARSFAFQGNRLFATINNLLATSDDAGSTWQVRGVPARQVITSDGVFVLSDSGLRASSDNGATWSPRSSFWDDHSGALMSAYDRYLLVAGGNAGVLFSVSPFSESQNAWQSSSVGMLKTDVLSLTSTSGGFAPATGKLYAGTQSHGVFMTSNAGVSWSRITPRFRSTSPNAINGPFVSLASFTPASSTDTLLLAGTETGIYVTSNDGNTWSADGTADMLPGTFVSITTDGVSDKLFAGSDSGVVVSVDNGITWQHIVPDAPLSRITALEALHAADAPQPILIAGTVAGMYRSMNGGVSWTEIPLKGATGTSVTVLARQGMNVVAATALGLFRTLDEGETWTLLDSTMASKRVNALVIVQAVESADEQTMFAATQAHGVFVSTNGGAGWTELNDGFVDTTSARAPVHALTLRGKYLYAGLRKRGTWRRDVSDLPGVVGVEQEGAPYTEPSQHALMSQVMIEPNPFFERARIHFELTHAAFVVLNIVSITGEVLCTLVQEQREPGEYDVVWDARDLAQGAYYVHIQCGNETQTVMLLHHH